MPSPNSAEGRSSSQRMWRFLNSGASSRSKMRRCSLAALGSEQTARVGAVHAREQVAGADEAAEQSVAVDVGAEVADAAAPYAVARLPILARRRVEVRSADR